MKICHNKIKSTPNSQHISSLIYLNCVAGVIISEEIHCLCYAEMEDIRKCTWTITAHYSYWQLPIKTHMNLVYICFYLSVYMMALIIHSYHKTQLLARFATSYRFTVGYLRIFWWFWRHVATLGEFYRFVSNWAIVIKNAFSCVSHISSKLIAINP